MRWHCVHGTKGHGGAGLLTSTKELRARYSESHTVNAIEERPLTVRTLTRFLGIPDKRETQTLHFSHFKVIAIAMQHFKE